MTNLEALKAEIEPYSLSDDGCAKRLIDVGLNEQSNYTSANKGLIARCAITILTSFLSLTNESLGPTSQSYDRKGLENRIRALCNENGLDDSQFLNEPAVYIYPNMF